MGSEGACSVLSAVRLLFAQSFFCSFLSPSFGFLCVFTSHYIRVGCGCFTCRFFLSLSWLPFFFSFLSFFSCASLCVHACVLGGRVCAVVRGSIRTLDCLAEASSKSLSFPLFCLFSSRRLLCWRVFSSSIVHFHFFFLFLFSIVLFHFALACASLMASI